MKDHAYLTDIDRLLVHSWMPLLRVDDFTSFIKNPENWEVPIYFLDLVWLIAKAYDHTDSQVWKKLLSVSFSHEGHTSFWRTTFTKDFEGKLKREHPVDQIGIYSKKMEELSKTSPLLCITMEKCALDAVAAICQDKSGKAVSALIEKHDIRKFGKLMSVVVLKTWPTDANGEYIEGEDLIFEYLVNNPMAQTVFQMTDALCDDGRCKDDSNMRRLLRIRKEEAEAVHNEKDLVRSLLQICQELPQHVKIDYNGLDKKNHQNIEMMNLNEFMKPHILDGQTSASIGKVTFFNLCDATRQMALELHAIKDSAIFKMCWTNQVEELSRDRPDTDDTEPFHVNEELYTFDLIYSKIFQTCYSRYRGLYDGLKSGDLFLEEIDCIFED
ncbi:hypothetical protein F7725_027846 [Dissostichus mawsoni]|uniref:Uncharacterized protein n=1 Tax=Dissostichus mawsoni TaxID=36200 RepID=A0A7J5XGE4_DISMA|nr:hypothetical protein F7725_027846 [Dissostichus mawsoni]